MKSSKVFVPSIFIKHFGLYLVSLFSLDPLPDARIIIFTNFFLTNLSQIF